MSSGRVGTHIKYSELTLNFPRLTVLPACRINSTFILLLNKNLWMAAEVLLRVFIWD